MLVGTSRVSDHYTTYTFVRVNGTMYKNVKVNDYLDSFINVGETVRMSLMGDKKNHLLVAIQTKEGDIHKTEINLFSMIVMGLFIFGLGLFLAVFLGLIFIGIMPINFIISALILGYCIPASIAKPRCFSKASKALDSQKTHTTAEPTT
ncbi:hypothetical protein [Marinobacter sp.]|uniref:hypothetical protein n=1 Tax=Marinobacter sp. TaxID=50741 RepID=UPI003A9125DF